ncbi:MAG: hypothetical protein EOO08_14095 [Chitinophagaceae bacterium]|nr:MAG: hypothetical protein EOO08_14095 [Chitinophagaceae bacterium]
MKFRILLLCLMAAFSGCAQKVVRFEFNLYTDSLKRGFYNYISVDAQLSDSSWRPLDSTKVIFTSDAGHFRGNDLFIDSSYLRDSVCVRATLRENPRQWKEAIIYIRRRGFGDLPTEEEVINGKSPAQRRRNR